MLSKRKHVRVPLSVPVKVQSLNIACDARAVEVGGGGMSLADAENLSISQPVQLTFILADTGPITIQAVVWWKKDKLTGVRFDLGDDNRKLVEEYVANTVQQ